MYLILQLARLGDMLQTARLVESVRRRGETHLVVDATLVDAARLAYPGVVVHGVDLSSEGFAVNARLFAELAGAGFRTVYNLNHAGFNRALARLFSPECVRGYRAVDGQCERDGWMRLALRWTTQRRAAPLNLVDLWGLLDPDPVLPEAVNPPAVARIRTGSGPLALGVVLAGRHARRSLPPHVLALAVSVLFDRLRAEQGVSEIRLLGGKAERGLGRDLMGALSPAAASCTVNLAGRTSLTEVFRGMEELGCLLTPDTGLMHMAARLGVPVQATFLSSAWAWETGPYGLGHTVWQAALPCAPCLETAPCHADVACARLFGRNWLRALSGSREDAALRRMESAFDGLGLIWQDFGSDAEGASGDAGFGISPEVRTRAALRQLLAEDRSPFSDHDHIFQHSLQAADLHNAAAALFTEADWMLPDQSRSPGGLS